MSIQLAVTPLGRIVAVESTSGVKETADGRADAATDERLGRRIAKRFANGQAEGLFALATERGDRLPNPSFAYWRDFAARYLTDLCHTPDVEAAEVPPPSVAERAAMLLNVPPMQGAEYLNTGVLGDIWADLDAWSRREAAGYNDGLAGFLKDRASLWNQVGRVCFHLAENRRDPEHPFAFLATYAPGLTAGARVQYQPLSKALREYAGAKDRKALVKLLSPVQRACEKSNIAKQLVESGDLYQPLAWERVWPTTWGSAKQFRCWPCWRH